MSGPAIRKLRQSALNSSEIVLVNLRNDASSLCKPESALRKKLLRILILEDSVADAELEVGILQEAGYVCRWQRVQEREEFLAGLQADHDLILADHNLPGFDGQSALDLVRARGLDIPFILILSGAIGEEATIDGLAGATDYVMKGRLDRLVPVVQRALAARRRQQARRRTEEALAARDARLRLATTQMPAVLWTTDTELSVSSPIGAGVPLFDGDLSRFAGSTLYEVFRTADPCFPPIAAHLRALRGESCICEHRSRGRHLELRVEALRDSRDRIIGCLGLAVDITERRCAAGEAPRRSAELEHGARDSAAQLEAASSECDVFNDSVSHELHAPLRAIDGFTKALLQDYASTLDPKGQRHLQRVLAATARMGQLIDDLLNLSCVSRSEMNWQPVDLSALAQSVADALRQDQAPREVEFIIAPHLNATGDEQLLRLAMERLLGNAWKYTGKRPRARIELGITHKDGQPVFFVRDNGAGFDMAFAGKLFAPFQRLHTRSEFEGTGMGLAIVERVVHRHGGRIWAEGAVDSGATFYFTLA